MEARLDRYARQLVEAARDKPFDEIVVVGHSLGATMAVSIVARAIELDPAIGTHGPKLCVLTVGSTIPKFSLHPDATRVRRDIERVATAGAVEWAEYHARADPISFYKFDPVTEQRVGDRYDRKPVIRMVRIRGMLTPETHWRIRARFMRVHHQFVMANELRNAYDFYMMGCGPIPFSRCVMTMEGPAALIGADGRFDE
jgi:pimeloyl-ACP methyl ester carboxylesterase